MNTMHENKSVPQGETAGTQRPGVSHTDVSASEAQREEEALRQDIEFFGRLMRISSETLPSPDPRTLRRIQEQAFRQAGRKAHRARLLRRALWPAIAAALLMAGISMHFARRDLRGDSPSDLQTTYCILILFDDEAPPGETLADFGTRATVESLADRLIELQGMEPEPDEFNLLQHVVPEPLPTTLQWHNSGAVPVRIYG